MMSNLEELLESGVLVEVRPGVYLNTTDKPVYVTMQSENVECPWCGATGDEVCAAGCDATQYVCTHKEGV